MKAVNHYVAWLEYKDQRSARYQGFAESLDEFRHEKRKENKNNELYLLINDVIEI